MRRGETALARYAHRCLWVLCLTWVGPAGAEVTDRGDWGFVSEHTLLIAGDPDVVFRALTEQLPLWWDGDHTYSGQAANLSLTADAGGCFCERWADGAVQHMRVIQSLPGRRLVLNGGLGPLGALAVAGTMTFELAPEAGATRLRYRYQVSGGPPALLEGMAEPVDAVQLGQLRRLQRFRAEAAAGDDN